MNRTQESPIILKQFRSVAEIDFAIAKLSRRLEEVNGLQGSQYGDPQASIVRSNIIHTILEIFGELSPEYAEYKTLRIYSGRLSTRMRINEVQVNYEQGQKKVSAILGSLINRLEEKKLEMEESTLEQILIPSIQPTSNNIFIVHGHHDGYKNSVARFITQLGLTPIILHEQANKGQTIIEKFESHASTAGFAVILLTGDDHGATVSETTNLEKRARQNVVFELGYFIGKLGRQRVCALLENDVTIPSDYSGVVYIPLQEGSWQFKLAIEIKNSGIPVDLNLIKIS